ncbi:MAG: hypothetical protein HRT44_06025 [Bdellovibrionales bacterium]|nr:hypothetical protein [Bdellovibrionales bacterium]NQZ18800.1 hypothetical protein [Bdellovibrionales bacterium]
MNTLMESITDKTPFTKMENFERLFWLSYYHLLDTPFENQALLVETDSLKSLKSFYQILIDEHSLVPCEIVHPSDSTQAYKALFSGSLVDLTAPTGIKVRWLNPDKDFINIY